MKWNNTFNVTVSDVNYPKIELQQLTSTNNLTQTTKTHITEKDRETPLRHYLFPTEYLKRLTLDSIHRITAINIKTRSM